MQRARSVSVMACAIVSCFVVVPRVGATFSARTGDPVLEGPVWIFDGTQMDERLGGSLASAGDVNGDGFADVIVGAPWFHEVGTGRVLVFLGSAAGLSPVPAWSVESDEVQSFLGAAVSTAGDVDGDGYDDVIVGANSVDYVDYDLDPFDKGHAYVYLGSANGLALTPDWVIRSEQNDDNFAGAVSTAGDVDGDGYADVLVGAGIHSSGQSREGKVWLYRGSPAGLESTPAWTAEGDQAHAAFGACVAGAGDVNADGYDDVVVGAPGFSNDEEREGRAYLYLGSSSGLSISPDWFAEGDHEDAVLGSSLDFAGDANGDGFDDVIVGAPGAHSQGRAYLYVGSTNGLRHVPAWTGQGDGSSGEFGNSVAGAGDLDADGYEDVLVSDYSQLYAFLGSTSGPANDPAWIAVIRQVAGFVTGTLASAGDIDGDGCGEILVGMPWFDPGYDEYIGNGRAVVYTGVACGGVGTEYCAATVNSSGVAADVFALGSASVTAADLVLSVSDVPWNQHGIFFHAATRTHVPFGDGYFCVRNDLVRGVPVLGSDFLATYAYDGSDLEHSLAAYVGSTRHFQFWFRDPAAGGALFNTSNAISIAVVP